MDSEGPDQTDLCLSHLHMPEHVFSNGTAQSVQTHTYQEELSH